MNDAPLEVLLDELEQIACNIDDSQTFWDGAALLERLEDMPKHIRTALAKRLME